MNKIKKENFEIDELARKLADILIEQINETKDRGKQRSRNKKLISEEE